MRKEWREGSLPKELSLGSLILFLFLSALILYPAGAIVFGSLWSDRPGRPGHFTLDNWIDTLGITFPEPLGTLILNTISLGAVTAALTVLLGVVMAYLVARTDLPFRGLFESLILLPRAFPFIIAAISWTLIFSERIGIINILSKSLFGAPLFNIYSFWGMVYLLVVYSTPVVFLIAINAFRLMDPSLEEQSRLCGSSGIRTFFSITLPLLRPLLLSTFVLIFVFAMIIVEVPIIVGMPAKFFTLISAIFWLLRAEYAAPDYNVSAALATLVTLMTLLLLILYRRAVQLSERFVTLGGKAKGMGTIALGRWRYPLLLFFIFYFLAVIVLPAFVIVFMSFSEFIVVPSLEAFGQLSLIQWSRTFSDPIFIRALFNSLLLATLGATAILIIAFAVGYASTRGGGLAKATDTLATIPLSYPSLVYALGFIWAFIGTPLYGTLWILLVFYIANYLPFAVRTLGPFIYQISKELEEASWMAGAGKLHTLIRVLVPLVKGGLLAVWVMVFQILLREFGGSIILFSFNTEVLATVLYVRTIEGGEIGVGAAIGSVILIISLGLYAIVLKKFRREF